MSDGKNEAAQVAEPESKADKLANAIQDYVERTAGYIVGSNKEWASKPEITKSKKRMRDAIDELIQRPAAGEHPV